MNEETLLDFIRSITALEDKSIHRTPRYKVRGVKDQFEVWDTYLLQTADNTLDHSPHVGRYVLLAADLNGEETAVQHDYDKRAEEQLSRNNLDTTQR